MTALNSLNGQILIAMPNLDDPLFSDSLIYICQHSEQGAMGLILNKHSEGLDFHDILAHLNITPSSEKIDHWPEAPGVLRGGPVESNRGFIIHSSDYILDDISKPVENNLYLTATLDILQAIIHGEGPERKILAFGYSSWAPGQLEEEIQSNSWIYGPYDDEVMFDVNLSEKYDRMTDKLGFDIKQISTEHGTA